MLQALLEYAQSRGLAAEPGFKSKAVSWLLVFKPDGRFLGVHPLGSGKEGELFRCPNLSQPEIKAGGPGCRHFLVDGLDVVAKWTKDSTEDEERKKLDAKHEYFVGLLRQASEAEPALRPIATALMDEGTLKSIRAKLAENSPKPKPNDLATFAVLDETGHLRKLVESDIWHDWWRRFRAALASRRAAKKSRAGDSDEAPSSSRMLCFLSGESVEPAVTHPKINGLADVGGMSAGDVLASFKQESFGSFGLEQARNAAMSEEMATVYADALNDLIRRNSERLAGSKVVFWYTGREEVPRELDPIRQVKEASVFAPEDEDEDEDQEDAADPAGLEAKERLRRTQAEDRARSLLTAIREAGREDLLSSRYRALTLAGNSGRVVVRDWMEGRFEDLVRVVDQWFEDLRIIRRDGQALAPRPKFLAVLGGLVRDLRDINRPLEAALWRCAIEGWPIPYQAMAMALDRFRVDLIQDTPTKHAQVGLLKAYCIRSRRPSMTPELDEAVNDPAYISGRILALLGEIQRRAQPGVNVGVVQRYYASASTTPALVLGRLVRLANTAHLPQIKSEKLRDWFDRKLADLWARLRKAPPRVLSLEDQTLFALGFYHQKAVRPKKKPAAPDAVSSRSAKPADQR